MINREGITFSESVAPQLMSQMQCAAKFCEAARFQGDRRARRVAFQGK